MANREALELQAAALNINAALYPNDSVLEQTVLAAAKASTAVTGTASRLAPSAKAKLAMGG